MQVENDPSPQFYKDYNKLIHFFTWQGKSAKIPGELLQCVKEHGGLKLVNLQAKNDAVKMAWFFREDEYMVQHYPESYLRQ